jgi:hypothetical protein
VDEPVAPGVVDVEPDGDVVVSVDELGADGVGEVAGGGTVVGGEADGTRSPGRSLVRGVSASVQPVARVATRASAETPRKTRLMNAPPERCSNQDRGYAREVPPVREPSASRKMRKAATDGGRER